MKILQVLPALEQGGVERGTIEVATALTARGIPNAVASQGGRLVAELDALGVKHYQLDLASKNPFTIFSNARKLSRIALDGGFSLMHVRSRAPAWSVKKASQLSGVPFISTWHGLYGTSPKFLKLPYNRVMLGGLGTIAVSDCVRRHILNIYGAAPEKVHTIHRGADIGKFYPTAVTPQEALAKKIELGFSPETPIITLPGRLTSWKGQHILLEAAAKMKSNSFGLLFIGSDQGRTEYSEYLRSLAQKLSGIKTVFLEHSSNMPLMYALSDVVVSASSQQPEAFGRVIPEAQAMGRIVVATAHGGACETVADTKSGFLVPPGNSLAMAETLDNVLQLPNDVKALVTAAAVKSVQEQFSIEKMCVKTIEYYKEVLNVRG